MVKLMPLLHGAIQVKKLRAKHNRGREQSQAMKKCPVKDSSSRNVPRKGTLCVVISLTPSLLPEHNDQHTTKPESDGHNWPIG